MINIISTQANANRITGPYKVYKNLIKGLDKIGYPYVINRDLNATKRLWIHDDVRALRYINECKAHPVVGPNLVVMPHELQKGIELGKALYLQPSEWVVKWWEHIGFNICPLRYWPVGIDSDEFQPSNIPQENRKILVYYKKRDPQELIFILKTLKKLKLQYGLVSYGSYNEKEYKSVLSRTSFIIWHGSHESQGLALQEALACEVPILVCDCKTLGDGIDNDLIPREYAMFPATAAPYFDKSCGVKISNLDNLPSAIEEIMINYDSYTPRKYILDNLSLEKQAAELMQMWEYWGLTFNEGYHEKSRTNRIYFDREQIKLEQRIKRAAKKYLKRPLNIFLSWKKKIRINTTITQLMRAAFAGDGIEKEMVKLAIYHFDVRLIVETGTYTGKTTYWLADKFPNTEVLTCEIDEVFFNLARKTLARKKNVQCVLQDSVKFIEEILNEKINKHPVFFFLDAHGMGLDFQRNNPLRRELQSILSSKIPSFIVVDDFKVRNRPDFAFCFQDSKTSFGFPEEVRMFLPEAQDIEGIRDIISENDNILFPNYNYETALQYQPDPLHKNLIGYLIIIHGVSPNEYQQFLQQPLIKKHYSVMVMTV